MFIQTEDTPNPATLKFLPGCEVLPGEGANFASAEAAGDSPLAARLFAVEGVGNVFLGGDFIAVTCAGEWRYAKPLILGAIMEHFRSGEPVLHEAARASRGHDAPAAEQGEGKDGETIAAIKELLDTRVRPAVARDGGDIVFSRYESGIVYLHMRGACAGCPSATMTLQQGIENLLRHYIPEVAEVRPETLQPPAFSRASI